jgi:hypothetical protein
LEQKGGLRKSYFPFIMLFITLSLHASTILAAERKRNKLIMRGVVPEGEEHRERGEYHGKYN